MTPWAEATESIVFYYNCIGLSQIATEDNRAKQASVYKAMAGKKKSGSHNLCSAVSASLHPQPGTHCHCRRIRRQIVAVCRQCGQGLKRR